MHTMPMPTPFYSKQFHFGESIKIHHFVPLHTFNQENCIENLILLSDRTNSSLVCLLFCVVDGLRSKRESNLISVCALHRLKLDWNEMFETKLLNAVKLAGCHTQRRDECKRDDWSASTLRCATFRFNIIAIAIAVAVAVVVVVVVVDTVHGVNSFARFSVSARNSVYSYTIQFAAKRETR